MNKDIAHHSFTLKKRSSTCGSDMRKGALTGIILFIWIKRSGTTILSLMPLIVRLKTLWIILIWTGKEIMKYLRRTIKNIISMSLTLGRGSALYAQMLLIYSFKGLRMRYIMTLWFSWLTGVHLKMFYLESYHAKTLHKLTNLLTKFT